MVPCSVFYEKQHPATRTFPPVLRNVVGKPLKQMFAEFKARPALSPTQTCQNIVIIPSFLVIVGGPLLWLCGTSRIVVFRDLLDSVVLLCSRCFIRSFPSPPPQFSAHTVQRFMESHMVWLGRCFQFSQVALGPAER